MSNIIKIKALKFPDIPHYEWEGELLRHTEDYVIVLCKPGRKLIRHTKNLDEYTGFFMGDHEIRLLKVIRSIKYTA